MGYKQLKKNLKTFNLIDDTVQVNRHNDLCKTIQVNRDTEFDDDDDNCEDDN